MILFDPAIVSSARHHGVADDDILHAYCNPIRWIYFPKDDITMYVGADHSGRLLEIGAAEADGIEFVIHAMPARDKYLR